MKVAALLLPLVAVAMAAPAAREPLFGADAPAELNAAFKIVDGVLVGPGGYLDENGFHDGEFHGKRDVEARELEERTFLLKAKLWKLLKLKGWILKGGIFHGPGNQCWGPHGHGPCGGGGHGGGGCDTCN